MGMGTGKLSPAPLSLTGKGQLERCPNTSWVVKGHLCQGSLGLGRAAQWGWTAQGLVQVSRGCKILQPFEFI